MRLSIHSARLLPPGMRCFVVLVASAASDMGSSNRVDSGRAQLAAGVAIDATGNRPFGEELRLALELPWSPGCGAPVIIGVVFERAAERPFEVPEISRRDRVAPGADVRLPALAAHREPAAEHLVDVADCEGNMIETGAAGT